MHLWGPGGRERDPVGPPPARSGAEVGGWGLQDLPALPVIRGLLPLRGRGTGGLRGGCGRAGGIAPPPTVPPLPAARSRHAPRRQHYIYLAVRQKLPASSSRPPRILHRPPRRSVPPPPALLLLCTAVRVPTPPPQISPLGPPRAQSRGDLGEGVPASAVRAPPAAPRPTILRGGGEAIGPSAPPPCVELWGWGCGGGM